MAEARTHSLPKGGATGRATSANQSSLGDTAVAAKAAHRRFDLGGQDEMKRWMEEWMCSRRNAA